MAQGGKAPQSFKDAMGDVNVALSSAMLADDAPIPVLQRLQEVVLAIIKHPNSQPGGAQPTGPAGGGAPPGGAPSPGGPAPSPGGQAGPPPPPQGGPQPHPTIPQMDPDEMRRVIAQSTGS